MMLVVVSTLLTALGQMFFKIGANFLAWDLLKLITNHYLIIALILNLTAAVLFFSGLKYGELSVLYPILALGYVWVLVLSYYFLQESINVFKIYGVGVILLGVSLIGVRSKK